MAGDSLAQAVRHQLGPGRLLPLGEAGDGAWLVERAAVAVLRSAAADGVREVRLGKVRLTRTGTDDPASSPVPAPPSALRAGPLRLEAEIAVGARLPLTTTAERLREVLLTAADRRLGLRVTTVDLRITSLMEEGEGAGTEGDEDARPSPLRDAPPPAPADGPRGTATAEAVIAVPGVARLAPVLGPPLGGVVKAGGAHAVTVTDTEGGGRHLTLQLAVREDARALDVARAVREAASRAAVWDADNLTGPVTVAAVITAVDPAARR
jgi:hypothetical protein